MPKGDSESITPTPIQERGNYFLELGNILERKVSKFPSKLNAEKRETVSLQYKLYSQIGFFNSVIKL